MREEGNVVNTQPHNPSFFSLTTRSPETRRGRLRWLTNSISDAFFCSLSEIWPTAGKQESGRMTSAVFTVLSHTRAHIGRQFSRVGDNAAIIQLMPPLRRRRRVNTFSAMIATQLLVERRPASHVEVPRPPGPAVLTLCVVAAAG